MSPEREVNELFMHLESFEHRCSEQSGSNHCYLAMKSISPDHFASMKPSVTKNLIIASSIAAGVVLAFPLLSNAFDHPVDHAILGSKDIN